MSPNPDDTPELTGSDAGRSEAEPGDAGNGSSTDGGDLAGVPRMADDDGDWLEEDPAQVHDILPDQLVRGFSDPDADEREVTAQPAQAFRPITSDLLPSDDPGAAEGDPDGQRRAATADDPGKRSDPD